MAEPHRWLTQAEHHGDGYSLVGSSRRTCSLTEHDSGRCGGPCQQEVTATDGQDSRELWRLDP